jgi:hypothetical protein
MYRIASYLIIALNVLLIIMVVGHEKLTPSLWIEAGGRLHPLLLHIPIGFVVLTGLLFLIRKSFELKSITQILNLLILLSALSAVLSAIAGMFIATAGDYSVLTLDRHRNLGLALSLLTALLTSFTTAESHGTVYFKAINLACLIVVILTGHYGASLTHGEDFLSEPFRKGNKNLISTDSLTVFEGAIKPVLEKKCVSCHNEQKKKGQLVLTSPADIEKGGENGPLWIPGNPDSSQLVKRIHLPTEHDDHMPPNGKPQLTSSEIKLLEAFILAGADARLLVSKLEKTDSLHLLASKIIEQKINKKAIAASNLNFIDADLIKNLNNPSRTVTQESSTNPEISVGFYIASGLSVEALKDLDDVAENVSSLNLSAMPVTPEILKKVNDFKNLKNLNLNKSTVTDDLLKELTNLKSLEKLDLANTTITSKALKNIGSLSGLQEVFIWGTKITPAELTELRKEFSQVNWNFGVQSDESEILKLTPPILVNESRILTPGEKIKLKHNLPGVEIKYTLNSEQPLDSISGMVYKTPLEIKQFTTIQARAIKNGWVSSEPVKYQFFTSGIIPQNSNLLSPPSKDYRAQGIKTLTDRKSGDQENFRDGQWLGYKENTLQATFSFSEQAPVNKVVISYLKNIGSYIMPPAMVEVYGSDGSDNFSLIKKVKPAQPEKYDPNRVEGIDLELNGQFNAIKIIVTPVQKLPQWHGGKGEKGWIMIDEIFFYPAPTI